MFIWAEMSQADAKPDPTVRYSPNCQLKLCMWYKILPVEFDAALRSHYISFNQHKFLQTYVHMHNLTNIYYLSLSAAGKISQTLNKDI